MFSFIKKIFGFLKKKKAEPDEIQVLLDDFKGFLPRRSWQEVDDIKRLNDTERAKRFINRMSSIHPQGKETGDKIIKYLTEKNS